MKLLPATIPTAPPMVGAWPLDTVQCCDALDLLRGLPAGSVDAIITDPPYGLAGRKFEVEMSDGRPRPYSAINESWDHFAPTEWMHYCSRVLKPGGSVICFGVRQSIYLFAGKGLELGWRIVNDVTWQKPDAMPNMTGRMMTESTERFLWFCPSGKRWTYNLQFAKKYNGGVNFRDVWNIPTVNSMSSRERKFSNINDGSVQCHPAQKPIELMELIVGLLTESNALIVDPFAGSGTTAVAARNLSRRFIGCDLSPDYVAIAKRRLGQPYTLNFMTHLDALVLEAVQ